LAVVEQHGGFILACRHFLKCSLLRWFGHNQGLWFLSPKEWVLVMAVAERGWRKVKVIGQNATWVFGADDCMVFKDNSLIPENHDDLNTNWIVAPSRG
jgi:hypothetical protein